MAADQLNFGYSQYVSDDGNTYCVRSDAEWIANADSGGAACTGQPGYGRSTRRRALRYAIYQDIADTFRSFKRPVFTPTAAAALTVGTSTVSVHVPGETAAVTYTLTDLVPEKRAPNTLKGIGRPDHT